jgi:hypothetical protein
MCDCRGSNLPEWLHDEVITRAHENITISLLYWSVPVSCIFVVRVIA